MDLYFFRWSVPILDENGDAGIGSSTIVSPWRQAMREFLRLWILFAFSNAAAGKRTTVMSCTVVYSKPFFKEKKMSTVFLAYVIGNLYTPLSRSVENTGRQ
jgi:hypothetical protein